MEKSHVTSAMDGWMHAFVHRWMDDLRLQPLRFKTSSLFLSSMSLFCGDWFCALVSAVFFQGWWTNHRRGWWQRPYPHPEVPQPTPQEIAMETRGTTNYFLSSLNHPLFNPFLPPFRQIMIIMLTSFGCFAICVTHQLNLAGPGVRVRVRTHAPNFHQWLTFVEMVLLMPLHHWLTNWVFAFCEI